MSNTSDTTRRAFLKVGAMAAVPAAGLGLPAATLAADANAATLARMADERALEGMTRQFVRAFNKGEAGAAALFGDGTMARATASRVHLADEPDDLALAGDGATVRFACSVEQEQPLEGEETLVRMARLQGNAAAVQVSDKVLHARFTRQPEGWRMASVDLA